MRWFVWGTIEHVVYYASLLCITLDYKSLSSCCIKKANKSADARVFLYMGVSVCGAEILPDCGIAW